LSTGISRTTQFFLPTESALIEAHFPTRITENLKKMLYRGPKQYCKITNADSIFIAGLGTTEPAAPSVVVDVLLSMPESPAK